MQTTFHQPIGQCPHCGTIKNYAHPGLVSFASLVSTLIAAKKKSKVAAVSIFLALFGTQLENHLFNRCPHCKTVIQLLQHAV